MQSIALPIWRLLVLLIWGTWWGGLFFYALFVVPVGTSEIGGVEQGFITQKVTAIHNRFSVAFLCCLAIEAVRLRSIWLGLLTATLSVNLGLLIYCHFHLTNMMNFVDRSVPSEFYFQHATYLWLFASEWLQGMIVALVLFLPKLRKPSARNSERSQNARLGL